MLRIDLAVEREVVMALSRILFSEEVSPAGGNLRGILGSSRNLITWKLLRSRPG